MSEMPRSWVGEDGLTYEYGGLKDKPRETEEELEKRLGPVELRFIGEAAEKLEIYDTEKLITDWLMEDARSRKRLERHLARRVRNSHIRTFSQAVEVARKQFLDDEYFPTDVWSSNGCHIELFDHLQFPRTSLILWERKAVKPAKWTILKRRESDIDYGVYVDLPARFHAGAFGIRHGFEISYFKRLLGLTDPNVREPYDDGCNDADGCEAEDIPKDADDSYEVMCRHCGWCFGELYHFKRPNHRKWFKRYCDVPYQNPHPS